MGLDIILIGILVLTNAGCGYLLWKAKKDLTNCAVLPDKYGEILAQAIMMVKNAERQPAAGEYKKFRVVYVNLQRQYPTVKKRDLALILEFAVQKVKKRRR